MSQSKSTQTQYGDILRTQANAEQPHNKSYSETTSSEIIGKERLPDSPLDLVSTPDGHFISFGQYRLTELNEDKNVVYEMAFERNYDLLASFIMAIAREIAIEIVEGRFKAEYDKVEKLIKNGVNTDLGGPVDFGLKEEGKEEEEEMPYKEADLLKLSLEDLKYKLDHHKNMMNIYDGVNRMKHMEHERRMIEVQLIIDKINEGF